MIDGEILERLAALEKRVARLEPAPTSTVGEVGLSCAGVVEIRICDKRRTVRPIDVRCDDGVMFIEIKDPTEHAVPGRTTGSP